MNPGGSRAASQPVWSVTAGSNHTTIRRIRGPAGSPNEPVPTVSELTPPRSRPASDLPSCHGASHGKHDVTQWSPSGHVTARERTFGLSSLLELGDSSGQGEVEVSVEKQSGARALVGSPDPRRRDCCRVPLGLSLARPARGGGPDELVCRVECKLGQRQLARCGVVCQHNLLPGGGQRCFDPAWSHRRRRRLRVDGDL